MNAIDNFFIIVYLIHSIDGGAFGATEAWVMVAGCLTAFLVSLAAISWLTGFVRRHTFVAFGVYRIVLGLAVIAWFALAA